MLNKKDWTFILYSVKAITGVLGGSLVLQNEHPWITLCVLIAGALSNEGIVNYKLKREE